MPVAVAVRKPAERGDVAHRELRAWRRRRPSNRCTGQPRSRALRSSPRVGLVGRGLPTTFEQLDVLAAVGVGEARRRGRRPSSVASCSTARRLPAPQRCGPASCAGELAVDHLEAGAEHVLDVEVGGHRLDLERQRRRRQHDGVALALVRGDERARLGVHAPGELLLEELAGRARRCRRSSGRARSGRGSRRPRRSRTGRARGRSPVTSAFATSCGETSRRRSRAACSASTENP